VRDRTRGRLRSAVEEKEDSAYRETGYREHRRAGRKIKEDFPLPGSSRRKVHGRGRRSLKHRDYQFFYQTQNWGEGQIRKEPASNEKKQSLRKKKGGKERWRTGDLLKKRENLYKIHMPGRSEGGGGKRQARERPSRKEGGHRKRIREGG